MDFTKKELETILSCIITTIEWTPSNVAPDFYDTLGHIEAKCQNALNAMVTDYGEMVSSSGKNVNTTDKQTYHAPEVTTSLNDLLSGIQLN